VTEGGHRPRSTRYRRAKTHWAGLHLIADDDPRWKHDPVSQARAGCDGGAAVVQLRAKHATDREVLAWGRAIRAATQHAGVRFFVNDRFDLALACDADGVHLGQTDLPPERIPVGARARLAVGRSTHDEDQLRDACARRVDYVAFGPVFTTHSKRDADPVRGLERLARAATIAGTRPLIAIGGIDATRVGAVRAAGAAGFAVIGAVAGADDPATAVHALVRAWEAS
jgi:thiamine-phosphate pyrophosphorylase